MGSIRFTLLFIISQFVFWHHANAAEARQLSDGHGSFFEVPSDSDIKVESSGLSESEQQCSDSKSCRKEAFGNATFSINPSRGPYPRGCRWRELQGNWEETVYEYWDEAAGAWTDDQPAGCRPKLEDIPEDFQWPRAGILKGPSPATSIQNKNAHFIVKNLWYNNGRWYYLVEGKKFVKTVKISRNQQLTTLHVNNVTEWLQNTNHKIVRGDTLFFDYIFFIHPTAIGHWCEMMFPLFSVLKESQFDSPDVNIVLLHLKRTHLMEWVRSVMATTLGVQPGNSLPPIWMQDETGNSFSQLTQPLEGVPPDVWVNFETAMVLKDVFTGGKRSFQTEGHAREFRAQLYQNHGLQVPASRKSGTVPPKVITFQRKRANRRIINEDDFIKVLRTYAPVNVVEFNSSHSFAEQLRTVSQSGLFISAHTSNLANSIFLPPGSAVVELIQRFWSWKKLDQSFKDQTDRMGDIHHFAWRAFYVNQTVYLRERDLERFGNWTSEQCHLEECVEAHTHVDIIVDLDELKQMLDARLPRVFAGESVSSLASVWPDTDPHGPQPWRIPPGTTTT